jgi:hypothetical protein
VQGGSLQHQLLLHRVSLGGQEWSPDGCKDACQPILSHSLHKISGKSVTVKEEKGMWHMAAAVVPSLAPTETSAVDSHSP